MLAFVFALAVKTSLFQSLLTDQRLGRTGTKLCWAVIATLNVILLPKMITVQLAALQLEPSYSFVRLFSCACSWWVAIVTSSCINIVWLACVAGWQAGQSGWNGELKQRRWWRWGKRLFKSEMTLFQNVGELSWSWVLTVAKFWSCVHVLQETWN